MNFSASGFVAYQAWQWKAHRCQFAVSFMSQVPDPSDQNVQNQSVEAAGPAMLMEGFCSEF